MFIPDPGVKKAPDPGPQPCLEGTSTKRKVSKRQVSKRLVSKRPVFKFDVLIQQKA
jgi:hypothetical protein